MDYLKQLIYSIELHAVEEIRACFENGINPNGIFNGRPLIDELVGEYTRTERFSTCVRAFVDSGLQMEDNALLAALLNDASALETALQQTPAIADKRYQLRCAYTPMDGVTLLHVCAEFNHLACAELLVQFGADVNAKAAMDEHGFGGQTPIFHTVNQNGNQSIDMLYFLLNKGADVKHTVTGLIWGKGYDWETFMPTINPISYAQMGLLPQVHRDEATIANVVSLLLQYGYGIDYKPTNIPCKYLHG